MTTFMKILLCALISPDRSVGLGEHEFVGEILDIQESDIQILLKARDLIPSGAGRYQLPPIMVMRLEAMVVEDLLFYDDLNRALNGS